MREDFRPILGYEGHYEINSEGVVRSLTSGKIRKHIFQHGYPTVKLSFKGIKKGFRVHRLVWESFMGDIPKGMYVLHGRGNDKTNSCLEYLSLGTAKDNAKDRVRDGRANEGSKNNQSVLTEVQVKYIKERLKDGLPCKALVSLFGVTRQTISYIKTGATWSHVA